VYSSFPLHPDVPPEGLSLRKLLASRGVSLEAAHQRMRGLLEAEGLEYRPQDTSYDTRLAQELGKWGEHQGKHEIHDALFRANFVEGVNLSKPADLVRIAEGVGLDAAEAQQVLSERTFRSEVDADWERARQYGITGVPTFVAGNRGVVGAQPYDVLEQLVQTAGARLREPGISRG
jgi:predicted DsbA family dithiol-disulfide isomerase